MFHECCPNSRWHTMPKPVRIIGYVVMGVVIAACCALLLGYVTMALWNAILPEISSLPALTFWQAVGLLLLARLFTGRFSHGHHRGPFGRRHRAGSVGRYAEWWDQEGEAAFRAYDQRTAKRPDDPA
ncbi:MAG TPA: hypothetical protein VN809_10825 [Telmatospirillum sp.]|nr:hypothetical protein [Telmatospirillum sp.]